MLASNIRTVETRYGNMSYYADDRYVGKSVEVYGEYSELEVELWRKFLKPGSTVIDAGANLGTLSLALADIVGESGRVLAFEPQPETHDLLQRNVSDNPLGSRIQPWDCALGAAEGETRMPSLAALTHKNYGGAAMGFGELPVKVRPLDAIVNCKIDFIKIDVEGAEVAILLGARDTIEKYKPILYIENHPEQPQGDLIRAVRALGYRAWEHKPALFNPTNFRGHAVDVFDKVVSFNILCVPRERVEEFRHVTNDLAPLIPARPTCGKSDWVGIARLGGIGDNLIAASVLRPLKRMGFKVDVITQMPQAVVFENNPFIDKLSIQRDLPAQHNEWQRWFYSRGVEYERFVNLSHTCESSLGFFQNQMQYQWPPEARRKIADHNYLEFACDIVGVPYEFGPLFFPTEEELEYARATRKKHCGDAPLIGWCVTGTRVDKIYPPSAHTVARLIKELGVHVALLGGPYGDFNFAKQIETEVSRCNSTLDGLHAAISPSLENETWPIRRMLTFAQICDLVIGPDTGPMWACAFEQMPKITLLSHASPKNITKHWINTVTLHAAREVTCWPCHKLINVPDDCIEERRRCGMKIPPDADKAGAACISSIPVETIVATTTRMMKRGQT
jgi:FkbM family methyltransferase